MTKLPQVVVFLFLAVSTQLASGFTTGVTNTYVNLGWSFSAPGTPIAGCNQIAADAVGDLTNSNKVIVYGALNCPSLGGALPITGVAYFGTDNTFNLILNVGTLVSIVCPRLSRLTGPCTILSSSGTTIGSGSISLI